MLASFCIDFGAVRIDKLRDRDKLIALFLQCCDQCVQCVCCILCTVMAQNDGTVAKMLVFTDRFNDGIDSVILPVQAVYIPRSMKTPLNPHILGIYIFKLNILYLYVPCYKM